MKELRVSSRQLACGIVLFLQLLPGQYNVFFGSGMGKLYQLVHYFRYIASALLFAYALSSKRRASKPQVSGYFRMFAPLMILIMLTELIAAVTSPVVKTYGFSYWSRSLSTILDRACIVVAVGAIWMLCGNASAKCMLTTLMLDGLAVILLALPKMGVLGVLKAILNVFSLVEGTTTALEVHEATFCIGMCLIALLFFSAKPLQRKQKLYVVVLAFLFLIGSKRIAFVGFAAACLFAWIVGKKGLSKRMLLLIGGVGVVICFAYIAIIYNSKFFEILKGADVNAMGRELIYPYFTRRTEFSVSQMGWGVAGISKAIENMSRDEVAYMQNVRGLHNDILKIYINFGFLGSLCWFAFHLMYLPLKVFRRFGSQQATLYMALAIYAFVTYLTDNTEQYMVFQVVMLLLVVSMGGQKQSKIGSLK